MAGALAKAFGSPVPKWPVAVPFAFELVSKRQLDGTTGVSVGEFYVDFSGLDALRQTNTVALESRFFENQQLLTDVMTSHRKMLEGSMVLIGDAEAPSSLDEFKVSGQRDPVPGVYIIASGAYTLLNAPLYGVKEPWAALIDSMIAIGLLLIVAILKAVVQKPLDKKAERRLLAYLTGVSVVTLFIIAGLLIQWTRVVWDDFLLVSIILILHPSAEEGMHKLWRLCGGKRDVPIAETHPE